jgi:hypothetical protein
MAHIETRLPAKRASGWGRYPRVAIQLDGSPLRFCFWFVELEHDDGSHELRCLRAVIEPPVDDPVKELDPDTKALTAPVVRDLANQWDKLESYARLRLELVYGWDVSGQGSFAQGASADAVPAGVRSRRELSPEFLASVVRRHREHRARGEAPTQMLAREERVSPSTVKHWLRKAREAGVGEEN